MHAHPHLLSQLTQTHAHAHAHTGTHTHTNTLSLRVKSQFRQAYQRIACCAVARDIGIEM